MATASTISSNTLSAGDVQAIVRRVMQWQTEHTSVFVMSDGIPPAARQALPAGPTAKFSAKCSVVVRTQMRADGPETVLDFVPVCCGGSAFTLTAAQADSFVRDFASPMYPALG